MKSLIVCALCALFTAVALAAPRPPRPTPIPSCPDPVPRCPDGRPAIDQWTAANELADLYCAAHPEIPACVASVVGGWCSSEQDCAALICGDAREVLDACRASASAGTMPAVCWTLFQ